MQKTSITMERLTRCCAILSRARVTRWHLGMNCLIKSFLSGKNLSNTGITLMLPSPIFSLPRKYNGQKLFNALSLAPGYCIMRVIFVSLLIHFHFVRSFQEYTVLKSAILIAME